MSDQLCVMSDLPPEMCSHCKGLDRRPPRLEAQNWVTAKYGSRCEECDGWIKAGDQIAYVEDGYWVCEGCAT